MVGGRQGRPFSPPPAVASSSFAFSHGTGGEIVNSFFSFFLSHRSCRAAVLSVSSAGRTEGGKNVHRDLATVLASSRRMSLVLLSASPTRNDHSAIQQVPGGVGQGSSPFQQPSVMSQRGACIAEGRLFVVGHNTVQVLLFSSSFGQAGCEQWAKKKNGLFLCFVCTAKAKQNLKIWQGAKHRVFPAPPPQPLASRFPACK